MKLQTYLFAIVLLASPVFLYSQELVRPDSALILPDTLQKDTIAQDTLKLKKKKKSDFTSKLVYSSKDSMTYSATEKKAYLFGDAKVEYEDINLTAASVDYDFANNRVFARSMPDTSGKMTGIPDFAQGDTKFTADSFSYNFKTKKGKTFQTNTKEGEGYLLANQTKKQEDGSFHIKGGKYTTCDDPHPHFYLHLSKAVVIPNNKIVSGPVNFVLEDVPLPLFIPFGFFPSKKQGSSGVRIPSYGENSALGFYLKDGGYYFLLNRYMDLLVTGDIYSRGTWGVSGRSSYAKRYKFNGSFSGRFYETKTGDKGLDLSKNRDFSIMWNHSQDAKANPTRSFSASVNYSSSSFDRNHNYLDRNSLTQNSKSSSVSYNKTWSKMNLSMNLRHSQNSSTKDVSLTVPSVSFNINRFYLFRGKVAASNYKWYENISLTYTSELINTINAKEDDLFKPRTLERANNGYKHSVPLSLNLKFLRFFNFTPSMTYSGIFHTRQVNKSWENGKEKVDTLQKFSYAHGFTPSTSLTFNPTLYGMAVLGPKSKVVAVRHVMTPSVSFSFVPDIKSIVPNYYRTYTRYTASDTSDVRYSIYDNTYYGTPSLPVRSGSLSFSLSNNLEIKVRSDKDTVTGTRKIKLIENLNASASYSIYSPSYKLSNIGINGSSTLFKDFTVNFNGSIDPYDMDSVKRIDRYYWKKHKGIGRLTSAGLSFRYTFKSSEGSRSEDSQNTNNNTPNSGPVPPSSNYTYFDVPWSFSFSYSLNYSKPLKESQVVQVLDFDGSISLTKKWNMGFQSGYDFKAKEFAYTTFNISRNLHCWIMTFDFAPFGPFRYYNFRITALSTLLNDLKYETRKDFYDYNYSRY